MPSEYVINSDGTRQHRKVVERYLGRPLTAEEVVHHINFDKMDNRVVNLIIFETDSDHGRFHMKKRTGLIGWANYMRTGDKERALRIFYKYYGITFYGPFEAKNILQKSKKMAEKAKNDLRLRETGALC
jgi:hypothetical protein